jgi:hypothetical protein
MSSLHVADERFLDDSGRRLYPGETRVDPEPVSAFRLDPGRGLLEVEPLGRKVRRRLTVTPR